MNLYEQYKELLTLTQLYLLQEYEPLQKIYVADDNFTVLDKKTSPYQIKNSEPLAAPVKQKNSYAESSRENGFQASYAEKKSVPSHIAASNFSKEKIEQKEKIAAKNKVAESSIAPVSKEEKFTTLQRAPLPQQNLSLQPPDFEDIRLAILKEIPHFVWLEIPLETSKNSSISPLNAIFALFFSELGEKELLFWKSVAFAITRAFGPCAAISFSEEDFNGVALLKPYTSLKTVISQKNFILLESNIRVSNILGPAETYLKAPALKASLWEQLSALLENL